jgi:tetraacyldisaccharide 4'-kinase
MDPTPGEHPAGRQRIDQRLARRGGWVELLRLPAAGFATLARLRAFAYGRGWLPSVRVEAPVVSIGNITAGGTGKTPFTAFLVRELARRGWSAGVLSRGYRTPRGSGVNDESRWMAEHLPDVPLRQDPDRVRGAQALVTEAGVDLVVLDDGFQHRRLRRDLDLVLVDATRPWGLPPGPGASPVRACLPRGLLREPATALARADAIVLTRCDLVAPQVVEDLRREVTRLAPGRPVLGAVHRAARLTDPDGGARVLMELEGREVDLVSALGNPESFQRTVESLGASVHAHRVFPDHHDYRTGDLEGLGQDGRWIVTSEKDGVKLAGVQAAGDGGARAHVLGVELDLVEGAAVLAALLDSLRPGPARRQRAALHEGLHG